MTLLPRKLPIRSSCLGWNNHEEPLSYVAWDVMLDTLNLNLEAVELNAISAKCEHNLPTAMFADPLLYRYVCKWQNGDNEQHLDASGLSILV